jgi:hypothetical protein
MADSREVVSLRRGLADALCAAQGLPVPRTSLQRMVTSLLWTAFAGLDEDSGLERAHAAAIALHALREWHALAPSGDQAATLGTSG